MSCDSTKVGEDQMKKFHEKGVHEATVRDVCKALHEQDRKQEVELAMSGLVRDEQLESIKGRQSYKYKLVRV
jgi:hypothetical protein